MLAPKSVRRASSSARAGPPCTSGSGRLSSRGPWPAPYEKVNMTKAEIILANKEFLFPCVFHFYKEPLVIARAKNQYVWDADGNQYLDFFGGIVTVSVGHCNETVNKKVHEQLDKLQHVSTVFANEPQAALAKRIAGITPGGKLTKSFFTNSGTEANETAILAARCYTGSHENVAHPINANCYRCPLNLKYPSCNVQCARDMDDMIRTSTSVRIAAFIAEPIQ